MKRRTFIAQSTLASFSLASPWQLPIENPSIQEPLVIGMVADAHQDIMHDAEQRLEKFIAATIERKTKFNIQLGDFCFPIRENQHFLQIWNQYKAPSYHVLGNHDMDKSTKAATMDYWGMEAPYYSFDFKGYHFVILDANYLYLEGKFVDYANANFYINDAHRTWINPEQMEWLKEDLHQTNLPTVVFSHQGLAHDQWGIKNRTQIQLLLEAANEEAGFTKVLACFNGHNHVDGYRQINGIYYIEMNSLSYQWLGDKYKCFTRYSKEIYDARPIIANVAPFEDALFAIVTFSKDGIIIEGIQSSWLGPSPEELGLPKDFYSVPYTPTITDRKLQVGN